MARHARCDRRAIERSSLARLRVVALVVLGAVVAGGGLGLVHTDDRSPAALTLRPTATSEVDTGSSTTAATASDLRPPHRPPAAVQPATDASSDLAGAGTDWVAVLGELDSARSTAFGLGDVALLSTVYADGSAPLHRDVAALLALATAGVRAVGLRLVVDDVTLADAAPEQAVLRVVDHMPAYELLWGDGSVAEERPGRGTAEWFVTLVGGDHGWRIAAITAG